MSSPLPIRTWPPTITHVDWNNLVRYGLVNCYNVAPSSPYTNQMYVNTTENVIYRYDGANWVAIGNGGTGSLKVDNILPWHNNYINFKADMVLFGNLIFTGSRLATSMNPLGSGIALGSPSEAYLGVVAKTLYASELQFTGSALSGSVTIKSPLIFPDMGMIITITGSDHWVVPKPGYTPTNHYSYLYVSTISPEDNTTVLTDPVLSTNQAFFVQKDFQTHGFVGSSSDPKKGYGGGAILMGQGFTGYYCPPQFSLTGVMIDMDDVLGEYAKGTVLPAQPSGSQWFYRTDTKVLWRYLNGWQAKYPNVQSSYYDTLFLIRGDTENPANLYINGLNVNSIYPQYNTWVDLWAKLNIHGNFQLSGSVVSSLNPSGSNLALGSSTEQWSGSCIKNNWCDAIRPLNNTWVEVRSKLNIYGDLQLTNGRVVSSLNPSGSIALGGPDEQWLGVTAKDVYCNDITPIPADKGGNGTWVDVNSKLNIHGDLQLTGGRVASALNPTGSLGLGGPGEAWTGLYATTVYTDNLKKLDNTSWNLTGSDKYYVNSLYPFTNGTWIDVQSKLNIHGDLQITGGHVVSALNPSGNIALGSGTEKWTGISVLTTYTNTLSALDNTWITCNTKLNLTGDFQLNGRVVTSLNPTGSVALGSGDEPWSGVAATTVYTNNFKHLDNTAWVFTGSDKYYVNSLYPYTNGTWIDIQTKLNIHGDLQLTGGHVVSSLNPSGAVALGGGSEKWTGVTALKAYINSIELLDNTWVDCNAKLNLNGDFQLNGRVVSSLNPTGSIALGSGDEPWNGVTATTVYTNNIKHIDNTSWVFTGSDKYYLNSLYPLNNSWIDVQTKLNIHGDLQITNGHVVSSLNPSGDVALGGGTEKWSGVTALKAYINTLDNLDNEWINVNAKLIINGDLQLNNGKVASSLNPRTSDLALGGGSEKWLGVTALTAYINTLDNLDNTWIDVNAKLKVNGDLQFSGVFTAPSGSIDWSCLANTPTAYISSVVSPLSVTSGSLSFTKIADLATIWTKATKIAFTDIATGTTPTSWTIAWSQIASGIPVYVSSTPTFTGISMSGNIIPTANNYYCGSNLFPWQMVNTSYLYADTINSLSGGVITVASTMAFGSVPFTISSTTKITNLNADKLDDKHASDFQLRDVNGYVTVNGINITDATYTIYKHANGALEIDTPSGVTINKSLNVGTGLAVTGNFSTSNGTVSFPSGSIEWSCLKNVPATFITSVTSPLNVTNQVLSFTPVSDLGTIWTKGTKIAFGDIATGATPISWTIAWSQIVSGIPVYVSSTPTFTGVSMSGNIIPTVAGSPSTGFYNGSTNFPWQAVNTYGLATNSLNTVSGTTITIGATLAFGNVPFTISSSALIANLHAANSDSLGGVAASGYITTSWKGSTSVNTLGTIKTGSWQGSQITCGYLNLNSTAGTKTSDLGNIWSKATKIAFGDITTGSTPTSWTIAWSQIASGIPSYVSANPTFNGITISNGADTSAIAINGSHALEISNLSVMVDKSLTCGDGTNGLSVSGNAGISGTLNINKLTINSNAGTNGQLLTSRGTGVAPEWSTVSVPRIDKGSASTNASGVATVTFGTAFSSAPTVVCTPTSGGTVSLVITGVTTTGFSVKATQYNDHKHLIMQQSALTAFNPTLTSDTTHTHSLSSVTINATGSTVHVSGTTDLTNVDHWHGVGTYTSSAGSPHSHGHTFNVASTGSTISVSGNTDLSNVDHWHGSGTLTVGTGSSHTHSLSSLTLANAGDTAKAVSGNTDYTSVDHWHGAGSLGTGAGSSHTHGFSLTINSAGSSTSVSGSTGLTNVDHWHGAGTLLTASGSISHTHTFSADTTSVDGLSSHIHSVSNNVTNTGPASAGTAHTHSSNYYAVGNTGGPNDDYPHSHSVSGSTSSGNAQHNHGIGGNTGAVTVGSGTVNHSHSFSGTVDISHTHTHSETVSNESAHTHLVGGNTGAVTAGSGTVNHVHTLSGVSVNTYHTHGVSSATLGSESAHTHGVGGNTGAVTVGSGTVNHSHSLSGATVNTTHSHSISGSVNNESSHTHSLGGNSGSVTVGSGTVNHSHSLANVTINTSHTHTLNGTNTGAPTTHTHTIKDLYAKGLTGYNSSGAVVNIGAVIVPSTSNSTEQLYTKPSGFDNDSKSITDVAISFNWMAI